MIYHSSIHCHRTTWHTWQLQGIPHSEGCEKVECTPGRWNPKSQPPHWTVLHWTCLMGHANAEGILERRQQVHVYYQGNACCSIFKVRSPKSRCVLTGNAPNSFKFVWELIFGTKGTNSLPPTPILKTILTHNPAENILLKNLYATSNLKAKPLSKKTLGDVNDRHQFLHCVP